ncbi:6-phosphogluconolactonase [Salinarchaeum sp. Harcht-Bsk1]|uniref:lactonase family protein n=1 Tax=Salinarchaeum sp. Harcht-Bsk1 TaxID=1333523 RepID=UPI00034239F8|nr:lactonase family protein [Salinarchaeum sp. Harcht-Bsk1]AGN01232.1 6-phosphogluconolactonase [Salinarchaeum sp. Harcht-Bsk1]
MDTDASRYHAFVGTYTDGDSDGIYTCSLDPTTGVLERVGVTDAGDDPSFVAVHPSGDYLYAVNEVDDGAVTAMEIDRESGDLSVLNRVVTGGGADPCYCEVDATGEHLLVAHYTGGSVAVVPIGEDGRVDDPTHLVEHEGSGPNEERQEAAHPHSIRAGPANRFVYAPDLGADRVFVYEFDVDAGRLEPAEQPAVELPGGAGPRHMAFHPEEPLVYLLNELDSTLTVLERDPDTGALEVLDAASTLPDGVDDNLTADVHVHDSGEWVYASNRGHDSVAVFAVGEDGRSLSRTQVVSTGGEWPRNVALTPGGDYLLAENAHTDEVVTFAIDSEDGTLEPTDDVEAIPSPTCLQFLAAE